jgi:4-hydroxybenzoate polyprenyltransferase
MLSSQPPAGGSGPKVRLAGLIRLMRPKQWTKNALVFAAPLFAINRIGPPELAQVCYAFLLFCLVSGCIYIFNDYMDREADREHPEKRHRPLASGLLNPHRSLAAAVVMLAAALALSSGIGNMFFLLMLLYVLLNIAYSLKLKHVVIIDIMIIAAGFVIRAIAGGVAAGVPFTPWFLLCSMLLALFLAISKRRHELLLLQEEKSQHRRVLDFYSAPLLDQLNSIVTTCTIMCYALYTFTSGSTIHLMWTIPLVIYGIFRYLYLIHMAGKGGRPEIVLLEDRPLLVTVIFYAAMTVGILTYVH